MIGTATTAAMNRTMAQLAPPSPMTLSEWVDRYLYLSSESSAEAGKCTAYSFQRGPLDSISDPRVRRTVIKSATQMLKSFCLQAAIGYFSHQDPCPILLLQPGDTDANDFSKERIAPMLRDTPVLKSIYSESKSRTSDATITEKLFPGGMLAIAGAGSVRNVARRAIRILLCDEVDKYKPTVEGNVLNLARKRLATFRHRAKEVYTCSPTIPGSNIDRSYEESDKREYYIACPHCGEFQSLIKKWHQVRWDNHAGTVEARAKTARYYCEHCDQPWDDHQRWTAVDRGEWRATAPFAGIAGFWINELYSPWKTLPDIVTDFLLKKDSDPQSFINTSLAENWESEGESLDWEKLVSRREQYRLGEIPSGVLFLTAGVDVQKTWLQGHVWGWGRGRQRWIVDRFILEGDPYHDGVWSALTDQLNRVYGSGPQLSIVRMAVDSGYATQEVYRWAKQQGPGRVLVVKGVDSGASLVTTPQQVEISQGGKRLKRGARVYSVNVSMCKSELYGLLAKDRPAAGEPFPPGWVHFASDLDEEFFRQLTAEQIVVRVVKGYRKHEWIKTRERNEDLDCCNYARAAASVFGVDRFSEHAWTNLERHSGIMRPKPRTEIQPDVIPPVSAPAISQQVKPRQRVTPSSWMRSFLR